MCLQHAGCCLRGERRLWRRDLETEAGEGLPACQLCECVPDPDAVELLVV